MNKLVVEYERLRKVMHDLTMQMNTVDARLVEIEYQLPNDYTYLGDAPLDGQGRFVEVERALPDDDSGDSLQERFLRP